MEVFTGPIEEFPRETDIPEGVKFAKFEDETTLWVRFHQNVVYDHRNGNDLHLNIISPLSFRVPEKEQKYPLLVWVQGSGWLKQELFEHIYEMFYLMRKGYAIAMVEVTTNEYAPFPAMVEDAKTAMRYMKKHADEYRVDKERCAFFGDSSGAHTVLLAGLTDDGVFDNGKYSDESAKPKCILEWYGPTEMGTMHLSPSMEDHESDNALESPIFGFKSPLSDPEFAKLASPITYVTEGKEIPPICILHGDADEMIPFSQSAKFYRRLKEVGADVEMTVLEGAHHAFEGFLNVGVLDICDEWLKRHL